MQNITLSQGEIHMTTFDSTQAYHTDVKKFFGEIAQTKARDTHWVQRQSPLDGSVFLLSLVLTVFQSGTIVLDQLAKTAHQIKASVQVTGQAFKERFTASAVAFLKAMWVEALKLTAPAAPQVVPLLSTFSAVYALDSSVITLPEKLHPDYPGCGGAGAKAAAKVYLLLNWLTGGYETIRIEAGRKADQNMGAQFLTGRPAGALWLFDLGFFQAAFLALIAQASSFFLCRLPASQQSFWVRSAGGTLEPLDLDRLLRRCPRHLFEIKIVFGPHQEVAARLIIAPVPPAVAATRRRKVREAARTQGRTPTQRTLNRCDWTLLLTNARPQQLPTTTVGAVYSVRWQVELVFKLFKSDAHLETTLAREPHRAAGEFYAKLIALVLFNRVSGLVAQIAGATISPTKLWRRMRHDPHDWLCVLGQGPATAVSHVLHGLTRYAKTASPKKSTSTYQRLQRAATAAEHITLPDPLAYLREKKTTAAQRRSAFASSLSRDQVALNSEPLDCRRAAEWHRFMT